MVGRYPVAGCEVRFSSAGDQFFFKFFAMIGNRLIGR